MARRAGEESLPTVRDNLKPVNLPTTKAAAALRNANFYAQQPTKEAHLYGTSKDMCPTGACETYGSITGSGSNGVFGVVTAVIP